jgi:hypothetical protein
MNETRNFTGIRFWRLELTVIRLLILSGETDAALEWIEGLLSQTPAQDSTPH